ncbi:MAG: HAD family hydrolase [Bryobacteraceae bacterium]
MTVPRPERGPPPHRRQSRAIRRTCARLGSTHLRRRTSATPAPVALRPAYLPSKGVVGMVEGRAAALAARMLEALDLPVPPASAADGTTVAYLAVDGKVEATLSFGDPLKSAASSAIAKLRAAELDLHLLTGDNRAAAEAVAGKLGIAHIEAGVLPAAKHDYVARLAAVGRVAMAGDGVQ